MYVNNQYFDNKCLQINGLLFFICSFLYCGYVLALHWLDQICKVYIKNLLPKG